MSVVGGRFKYDVFVSHSHQDKTEFELEKWFEILDHDLQNVTVFGDSEPPAIRMDESWQLPDIGLIQEDEIRDELENSATLLILLSPEYLRSDWSRKELDWWKEAQEKAGLPIGSRVIVVEIEPVERDNWLSEILEQDGILQERYRFFDDNGDEYLAYKPGESQFDETMENLANDIRDNLNHIKELHDDGEDWVLADTDAILPKTSINITITDAKAGADIDFSLSTNTPPRGQITDSALNDFLPSSGIGRV